MLGRGVALRASRFNRVYPRTLRCFVPKSRTGEEEDAKGAADQQFLSVVGPQSPSYGGGGGIDRMKPWRRRSGEHRDFTRVSDRESDWVEWDRVCTDSAEGRREV